MVLGAKVKLSLYYTNWNKNILLISCFIWGHYSFSWGIIIVISGKNSSNKKLRRVTAGASTPDWIIQKVVDAIELY